MNIHDLFARDINRSINGVVQVQDAREESLKQELEEYVVTRELRRHFDKFFDAYDTALDTPTDKIGVWISGHFGSGKSHFLKMLSYLLKNDEVAGKRAIDYFDGKIDDQLAAARMRRCCEVPTETILFNIDTVGGQFKEGGSKTALLRSFERVFFDHLGFYGEDLKLAKLEKHIDERGKTREFRAAFERETGLDWLENREGYVFYQDGIVAALTQAMGMSEQAALGWFDGTEDASIAPDRFVAMSNESVDACAEECGGEFRLLFMADEVGQYVGEDVSLMLNLQTLVEEIGSKCKGRVWVMVTSQEAIDEVAMVVGNDFSKIQGRFNTRLSLSSSSVDEVIQRRVLEKTPVAMAELEGSYATSSTVLKNLFAFDGSRSDLIGYATPGDFAACYPFVNYQFKVLPDVMDAVRKHGVKAKHMSTGERSMLSAFSESVQAVQTEQVGALVPFWHFFDTIAKDLEHGVIQVVERATRAAEDGRGLEPFDVRILKLLYLIRYIDYVKSNVENISILMIDQMDADKALLKAKVQDSLDRLVRENYVARQGEVYNFLTDEEQDIARAISEMQPDVSQVMESVKKTLYSEVYTATKLRHGANDFPIDRYVDDGIYGASQGGMKLNVITMANGLSQASDGELELRSSGEALVVLSSDGDYFDVLMNAAKINAYVRTLNREQLPESTRQILTAKQREARANTSEAASLIREAVLHARCAVDGRMVEIRAAKPEDVFGQALERLADTVFSKACYVAAPARDDDDVRRALAGQIQQALEGTDGGNARACNEVAEFLKVRQRINQPTTMGDLQRQYQQKPFGWREVDIACVVAELIAAGRVDVTVAGAHMDAADRQMITYLRGKQADKAQASLHVQLDASLLKRVANLMRDLTGTSNVPTQEKELLGFAVAALEELRQKCTNLYNAHFTGLSGQRAYPYPGREVLDHGVSLLRRELEVHGDMHALVKLLERDEDELLDWNEDFEQVEEFFDKQKPVFDKGIDFVARMETDAVYLGEDAQVAMEKVKEILSSEKPYGQIRHISELADPVLEKGRELVDEKRNEYLKALEDEFSRVTDYADQQQGFARVARAAVSNVSETRVRLRSRAHDVTTIGEIDALKYQLDRWCEDAVSDINEAVAAEEQRLESERRRTQVTETGEVVTMVTEAVPAAGMPTPAPPKAKSVRLKSIAPISERLASEADVDAYLGNLRERLLEELEAADVINLMS